MNQPAQQTQASPCASPSRPRMSVRDALRNLAEARGDQMVVVTNQGSSRVWPRVATHPLDFHYNPSTMGGAIPFGLGLALARPDREVIVVSGDGALLMSLGALVTVVASAATNITIVVLDNGLYEVTGGQTTPGALAMTSFVELARAAGFPSATHFDSIVDWQTAVHSLWAQPGPRFVCLSVEPADPMDMQTTNEPIRSQLTRIVAIASRS